MPVITSGAGSMGSACNDKPNAARASGDERELSRQSHAITIHVVAACRTCRHHRRGRAGRRRGHALPRAIAWGACCSWTSAGTAAGGKALDIRRIGPNRRLAHAAQGHGRCERATRCAVCVIADRFGGTAQWRARNDWPMLGAARIATLVAPVLFRARPGRAVATPQRRDGQIPGPPEIRSAAPRQFPRPRAGYSSRMEARCSALQDHALTVLGSPPSLLVVPLEREPRSRGTFAATRVLLTGTAQPASRPWPPAYGRRAVTTLGLPPHRSPRPMLESRNWPTLLTDSSMANFNIKDEVRDSLSFLCPTELHSSAACLSLDT